MSALLIAITLLLTIASAMGFGIVLGYGAITTILHAMGNRPDTKPAATLVAAAHGGD